MPYGFIKYIEKQNYSAETITSYQKVINQFFSYIKITYPINKEPFQISSSDIKNYLDEQQEKEKSLSTVNKELAILKTLFNYLWEINKVPVDPAVKLKRYKVKEKLQIEVSYKLIIDVLNRTLENDYYSPLRKAIFILATKGLKTAEFRFRKDDVKDLISEEKVEIKLKNRTIVLVGKEISYFLEYYYEALLNDSEFVFVTKPQGEEFGGPIQVMSILNHLRAISHDYLPGVGQSLTLVSIRRALAYELYQNNYPIQMIAKELGIEEISTANYLKKLTEVDIHELQTK